MTCHLAKITSERATQTFDVAPKGLDGGFVLVHRNGECYGKCYQDKVRGERSAHTVDLVAILHKQERIKVNITVKVYIGSTRCL